MELEITDRNHTEDGKRIDTLKGRYQYMEDSYYEMECKTHAASSPSHIEGNIKNCNE